MQTMVTTAPVSRTLGMLLVTAMLPFLSGQALAQTPARNLMPDGSTDMYLGAGLIRQPRYEGASSQRTHPVLLLQVQASNGVFVAGNQLGWHLSGQAQQEFGPLFMYQEGRSQTGSTTRVIGGNNLDADPTSPGTHPGVSGKLDEVPARLMFGGFYHRNLGGSLRFTSNFLYGAGHTRHAARFTPELQYSWQLPHASVSLQAGLVWANRDWNQAYFGVPSASLSGLPVYSAQSGVKDVHVALNWNWALSSSWLLTNSLKIEQLQGSAGNSPLVTRRSNSTLTSALAWRF